MRRSPWIFRSAVVLLVALLVSAGRAAMAGQTPGATTPRDPQTILDRIYSVAQAERGERLFMRSCTGCHAATEFSENSLASRYEGQSLGDVFGVVSTTMPQNDPGGLKPDDYASILAYFLALGFYPVGADDMPSDKDALSKFGMVPNPQ
jgi:mono/diheme cytochrome c family protein